MLVHWLTVQGRWVFVGGEFIQALGVLLTFQEVVQARRTHGVRGRSALAASSLVNGVRRLRRRVTGKGGVHISRMVAEVATSIVDTAHARVRHSLRNEPAQSLGAAADTEFDRIYVEIDQLAQRLQQRIAEVEGEVRAQDQAQRERVREVKQQVRDVATGTLHLRVRGVILILVGMAIASVGAWFGSQWSPG